MAATQNNWFTRLCRNVGLAVHHVSHPGGQRQVTRQETTEEKRGDVTLRRTTIEEIEIKEQR